MESPHYSSSTSSSTSSASIFPQSQRKGFRFFKNMIKKLEIDCDDVDLPEEQKEVPDADLEAKNMHNKSSTLENPFLADFFSRLRKKHKSNHVWFNSKK